ncbi:MAG: hypothetical protein MUE51_14065 [Thermoleophilia bacterium]|nr:hypothetical protein [Thermoleophilia bacterium]
MADRTQRAAAARRSPVVRLLYDTEGDLRARRVILIIAAVIGVATDPNVLAAGAVIIFLAIKLPLLALVWWLMTRHQERPGDQAWTGRERREILEYLERQARESVGRTDAVSRLSYLSREAWHVADTAPDEERAQAVSVAVAIAGLRAQAQAASRRGD